MAEKDKLELFYRGALAAAFFMISSHPDFNKHQVPWHYKILSFGKAVPCSKAIKGLNADTNTFSIYTDDKELGFRNEDRENVAIRFKWDEYKMERLLDLSRLKHQRELLKTFPK
jgi:hypothetical protein